MPYVPKYNVEITHREITIKEFVTIYVKDLDLNPIEQRLDVQRSKNETKSTIKATKRQGIIGDIFDGLYFGEVCTYELTKKDIEIYQRDFKTLPKLKKKAIHDGGHRGRGVYSYTNNEFPTHASCHIGSKYYHELTPDEREYFDNYKVLLTEFLNSSPEFRGLQFHKAGMATPLNHQEILNSYGHTAVANVIRKKSRDLGDGIDNRPHDLFTLDYDKDGNPHGRFLGKNGPGRLSYDRFTARAAYCVLKNGPTPCDDDELVSMYKNTSLTNNDVKKLEKRLDEALTFIYKIANAARQDSCGKKIIDFEEAVMLKRLYFSWKAECGVDLHIQNSNEFWREFSKAFYAARADITIRFNDKGNGDGTNGQFFGKKLRTHKNIDDWNYTVNVMTKAGFTLAKMIEKEVIFLTGRGSRGFDINMVFKKWVDNDRLDGVDGKPLLFADAVGAHIVPYSKGGTTDYSNLEVTSAAHNRNMGTMNLLEYKAALQSAGKIKI